MTIWKKYRYNQETTVESLLEVLKKVLPKSQDSRNQLNDYDMVCSSLYIGDSFSVKDVKVLKKIGITHVVNAAASEVKTVKADFDSCGIELKQVFLLDFNHSDIYQHLEEVSNYIDDAIKSGGKVLVNCFMGK